MVHVGGHTIPAQGQTQSSAPFHTSVSLLPKSGAQFHGKGERPGWQLCI
jgi:hypothetical protein